jgi:hypothetical protein
MSMNNPYQGNGQQYEHNNPQLVDRSKVNEYTLKDYGLTVDAVKANHFGIDVTDPRTGEHLPDAFYESKIESAVAQVEKMLDIVILPRYLTEHHDFYRSDFESFMYIHTAQKPILQVEVVRLEYGGGTVFNYPAKWWRVYNLPGHLEMLPTLMLSGDGGNLNLSQVYSGYPMIAGIPYTVGNNYAPQMFHLEYIGGMLPPSRRGVTQSHEMHPDLWNLIIKITLKEVFQQWGRLIIGAGIANMTLSIDGVSQSIDTTQSAMYGGASADIAQLDRDIDGLYKALKSYYGTNVGLV